MNESHLYTLLNDPQVVRVIQVLSIMAVYLLPTIIAKLTKHHQGTKIFYFNVFTGWTGLGWLGAFVWSLTAKPQYKGGRVILERCPTEQQGDQK